MSLRSDKTWLRLGDEDFYFESNRRKKARILGHVAEIPINTNPENTINSNLLNTINYR